MIILAVFVMQAALIVFLSQDIYENYKALQLSESKAKVEQETAEMMLTLAFFEEKAQSLAHAGRLPKGKVLTQQELDETLADVLQNFGPGIGGGIWYEPYQADPAQRRLCGYLFQSEKGRASDAAFRSDAYNYHEQIWYRQIKEQVGRGAVTYSWTQPYKDAAGSNQYMITIGAGIYDEAGNFIGMSTMDWVVEDLIAAFRKILPTPNSVIMLYGRSGVFRLTNDRVDTVRPEDCNFDAAQYVKIEHVFNPDMRVAVYAPQEELFRFVHDSMRLTLAVLLGACVLIVALLYRFLSVLIHRPVKKLAQAAQAIGAGDFSVHVEAGTQDELGKLAETFNKMTRDIKENVETIARITAERERLSAELHVARDIQSSMLPCIFPPFPERVDVDLFASMQPAREVGGDFYDFYLIDERRIAVVIADVSGKGVPAALFMVIAKTLLKNQGQQGASPAEIFAAVNDQLCENNEAGMFVTAFFGVLDLHSGLFTYVNGGHNPPYWCKANGETVRIDATGDLLLAALPQTAYHERQITLRRGDKLFLYTDGVTEAMRPDGEMFGDQRLEAILTAQNRLPPKQLVEEVKAAVARFAADAEPFDDITMLALECRRADA